MTEKLLSIGTRIKFTYRRSLTLFGKIIEIHGGNEYYRVRVTIKEAEKLKKHKPMKYGSWKANGGWIWVATKRVERACRLDRER